MTTQNTSFLKSVIDAAADRDQAKLYESIETDFENTFDLATDLVESLNEKLPVDSVVAVVECMAADIASEAEREGAPLSLNESISEEFNASVALLESLTELTIVGTHDLIAEDFQKAVDRILKSDRKLRMTSKDGKTKYKTRRRAAEAAAAASMAAVFGKKGVSRKAAVGKRG